MDKCHYRVGQVIPKFKYASEGVRIDWTDDGIYIIVTCYKPTNHEMHEYSSAGQAQVKLTQVNDVIFFLMKFGDLPWMDAPYSIHLSLATNLSSIPDCYIAEKNKGYPIRLFLVDTSTGELKRIRLFVLGNHESNKLNKFVQNQLKKPFNWRQYNNTVDLVYATYTTADLLDLCDKN